MQDQVVVPGPSVRTSSGAGVKARARGSVVCLFVDVTAVAGTLPSLALSVQWSMDGTTWAAADPTDAFTAITAVGAVVKTFGAKAPWFRVAWALGGTSPSFTFTVQSTEMS